MTRIPFHIPYITGKEQPYIAEVFENRLFAGNGPFTKRCQAWMEQRWGVPAVLLTHSCTGALELAALALDIGRGDEVILPSFTFITTATAFMRNGATPVFCEVDPDTMTMDPADVRERVTERTKAIVAMHYGGVAPDMDALQQIADEVGVALIEDAAQGIDAEYKGRKLGTFGALACLSFHETKNVHSGLGGALLVNDASLVERVETIWERGTNRRKFHKGLVDKYSWVDIGGSFYPSELQAAFLMAQLEGIDSDMRERRRVWERYHAGLLGLERAGLLRRPVVPEGLSSNHHNYWIRLSSPDAADDFRVALNQRDIHVVIHYVPLHDSLMGHKLGYAPDSLPITQLAAGCLIRLPMFHTLGDADVDRVIAEIERYFAELPAAASAE